MDNCAGQNKNNHVLRLALVLVELGYFKKVSFIFYIVGHTKNACDRWFNTLKKNYRTMNIWTFGNLLKELKTSDRIAIHTIETGDFKHYLQFEDMFYNMIEGGKIFPGHIFTVDGSDETNKDCKTTMVIKEDDLRTSPPHTQNMKKDGIGSTQNGTRAETLANMMELLKALADPGISDIKQIELWKRWRVIALEKYWGWFKEPSDDVFRRHKEKTSEKNRERNAKKKAKEGTGGTASGKKRKASTKKTKITKKKERKQRQQQQQPQQQQSLPPMSMMAL